MNQQMSVTVYQPLVTGGAFLQNVSDRLISYQHELAADGYFISATIAITVADLFEIEDWFASGLGRHVLVHSPTSKKVFEGFVNLVSGTVGGVAIEVGPLMAVANRVTAVYTPITDATSVPPTIGKTTETIIAEDAASQDKYGIIEKVVNAGTVFADEATYIRDQYLAENAYPKTSTRLTMGSSEPPSLTIEVKGYAAWLDAYIYNYEPDPATSVQASTKFEDVLDADPNSGTILSTSRSLIDFNGVLTSNYEDENRFAADILAGIAEMGGASGDRWLWGVGDGRVPYYRAMPSEVEYYYYLRDGRVRVGQAPGQIVHPSEVRPGKWLYIPDLMRGAKPTSLHKDLRAMFIERVSYTYPLGLSLGGTRVETLPQILKQYGLGGM